MAIPALNDYLTHWPHLRLGSSEAAIFLYWQVLRNTGGFSTLQVANQSLSWLANLFTPLLGRGEYTLWCDMTLYQSGTLVETVRSIDIPLSIHGNHSPLPHAVAALSYFTTADPKTRQMARTYWPFIRSDFLDSDTGLTVGGLAAVQGQANSACGIVDWGGGGFALRVARALLHKNGDPPERLVMASTSHLFSTQRRRNRGNQRVSWDS
jgi:hypothetical protein